MPQFVIEREMPGVGSLGPSELKGASQTSCSVLRELGPEIQWVNSYVTEKDALKKKEVSENDERRAQEEVQKMTDRHIAEIDKLLQQKETELMAV